jgi:hypothetical protein
LSCNTNAINLDENKYIILIKIKQHADKIDYRNNKN